MKNTSFPRLIAGAALSAAFAFLPVASLRAQVAQQSYLRNTASDADREDPRIQAVIARAENHFKLGELNLKDGKREQARDEFDKAVDAVLESGLDVRAYPRLQQYYLQLVERVYRVEVPTQEQRQQRTVVAEVQGTPASEGAQQPAAQVVQIGFVDQKFEPSPLDELSRLVLTEKEKEVSAGQVAEAEEEIKNSLDFQFKPHPLVLQFINYYQGRGRVTMETGLRRSGQFVPMAREIFRRHGIPEDVVWLGQVESAWRPTARSWAAASGLWQFIPSTGSRFGLRQTAFVDERNSFEKATEASARYLKWLYNRYHNWELALGAYNTGEGNIDRAIARAGTKDFWAIYPYIAKETRDYVPNILAVILISKNPQKYGFRDVQRMPRIDRQYDIINVPSATSLHLLASLTDSSSEHLRAINPELRRDTTPRGESYHMRVPAGKGKVAVDLLKRIPLERRDQLARVVTVSPGEDLQAAAARAGVSVAQLQQWNGGADLSKGGKVVVPAGSVRMTSKIYDRPRGGAVAGSTIKSVTAKGGETLAQIAAQNNASVEEVAKYNGIAADAQLTRGQRISIPTAAGAATPARPARRR
ncbi:MAG TPA: transglycosylase SLT domain-containing protein [Pyrinomonadaceae bacterium]|nr:transglycosylase SLT domain-containing protein [Pyrinomonadaceae bacterium]